MTSFRLHLIALLLCTGFSSSQSQNEIDICKNETDQLFATDEDSGDLFLHKNCTAKKFTLIVRVKMRMADDCRTRMEMQKPVQTCQLEISGFLAGLNLCELRRSTCFIFGKYADPSKVAPESLAGKCRSTVWASRINPFPLHISWDFGDCWSKKLEYWFTSYNKTNKSNQGLTSGDPTLQQRNTIIIGLSCILAIVTILLLLLIFRSHLMALWTKGHLQILDGSTHLSSDPIPATDQAGANATSEASSVADQPYAMAVDIGGSAIYAMAKDVPVQENTYSTLPRGQGTSPTSTPGEQLADGGGIPAEIIA